MISKETIDEILARNDIESLVGSYVALKRAGSTMKALCPFHSEKSPSFVVYPQNNSFYCFGCGIGGDPITFIRQIEHLDYPDALEFLAKRAGIQIVRDGKDPLTAPARVDKNRIYEINTEAAKFFHASLFADNADARNALRYFTEERKLSIATIRHFGLGYSPNSFDAVTQYLRSKGYTYEELHEAFITGKSEKGKYYDTFRDRVMFPIIDQAGRVIAFGGRVMSPDIKPKYRNSSDTPVFKKSRNLFALNFARHTCQDLLILCEGYMDVIALHAAGFTNAIATLGTAITADQCRMLTKYTKKVVISYDADEAGQKAAQRALKMLGDVGLDCAVLKIPGAKDPDEFIKSYGKERFEEVLGQSKTKFDYQVDLILSRYNIEIPQDKIRALNEIVTLISGIYSKAEQDIYIREIAQRFSVDKKAIEADVARVLAKNRYVGRKEESARVRREAAGYGDRVNPDFAKAPSVSKNEETVLGLLLLYEEHRRKVFDGGLLHPEDFYTELGKKIFAYIEKRYHSGDKPDDLNESFSVEEIGRITKMKLARMQLSDNGDPVLQDAISTLKFEKMKKDSQQTDNMDALNALIHSIKQKESEGN